MPAIVSPCVSRRHAARFLLRAAVFFAAAAPSPRLSPGLAAEVRFAAVFVAVLALVFAAVFAPRFAAAGWRR
ncbi:TPA: hypothetical protein QDC51_006276, partial [Burkholderia multivorans]|nr:hypothetical protein [Burkholderia multivorans]